MIIVGGTYEERVITPDSLDLMGSGMRAAAVLAHSDERPKLTTAIQEGAREDVALIAGALGVELDNLRSRNERVAFTYATPIASPTVTGPRSRLNDHGLQVESEHVLVFGMIEVPQEELDIVADLVVYDPQQPRDLEAITFDRIRAKRTVLIANATETRQLGTAADLQNAARTILEKYSALEALVIKRGAAGSLVVPRGMDPVAVGAFPTERVWPIGSGDAFTAGYANALASGADHVEAAHTGSAVASYWCKTRSTSVPSNLLRGDWRSLGEPFAPQPARVYLAGPFFNVSERWLIDTVKDELAGLGVSPWSPVHEVGPGGLEVAKQDIDGLLECDAVLALLDHEDPGTVFEVGWAVRHGIPVIGYATTLEREGTKMMAGTTVELHSDLSTACYRAAWAAMGLRTTPGWRS